MTRPWLRADGNGCVITVHVQPGAKRTEIVGEHGDALKIRLAAPPVDGKANEALLSFLAKTLSVSRRAVELRAGASSRRKLVAVDLPAAEALPLIPIA
ncbi:MAG: YggU family protein [Rhodocyclaceae bacterium]|nr:YggU family protein [Rhodocyclaceae bacterium]